MAALLIVAAAFVYVRLESDLTEAVDDALAMRVAAVTPASADPGAPAEAEDGFAQVLSVDGALVESSPGQAGAVLTSTAAAEAAAGGLRLERAVEGVDGECRILAAPLPGGLVAVVGQSLEDRDETLANLVTSFAIGGPIAIVLASLLGYALASAGLRPVEAMRRRAAGISLQRGEEALPLPKARDEIRRLGETLNEMLARLRASFEREQRFVADASHDLRSPIAVIRAELDAALLAGDLGPDARASVVVAIEECDALAALAEDMLVLARAADHALPLHLEVFEARAGLAEVATRFERRAAERGRAIRVEAGPGLEIRADRLRLRQALGNLLDNSLRHGAGDVLLAASGVPGAVALEVSDSGPGFAPAIAPRAFDRFATADAARAEGASGRAGAGLGLAIVRAVAEAHGGAAEIVPGDRTTVRITLPFRSQESLSHAS